MTCAVGYLVEAVARARTFSLFCVLTNSQTCSTELAGYKLSVLYSKLPAQFVSLDAGSRAKSGETTD